MTRTTMTKNGCVLLILLSLGYASPASALVTETTEPPTEITHTGATLNGWRTETEVIVSPMCQFEWEGEGGNFGEGFACADEGPFSLNIGGFLPGTTVTYRAGPPTDGPGSMTFTTLPYASVATTLQATNVTSSSAVLHGSSTSQLFDRFAEEVDSPATSCSFALSGATIPCSTVSSQSSCGAPTSTEQCYSAAVEDLAPDTIYSFAFSAGNAGGSSTGEHLTFTTSSAPVATPETPVAPVTSSAPVSTLPTTVATGPASPTDSSRPVSVRLCRVPRVTGLILAKAQKKLRESGCTTGRVRKRKTAHKPYVVAAQSPAHGLYSYGKPVELTLRSGKVNGRKR